jgi:hypothetical protein
MKNITFLLFTLLFAFCTNTAPVDPAKTTEKTPIATGSVPSMTPNWFCSSIEIQGVSNKTQRAVGGKTKFWPTGTIFKVGFIGGSASAISAVKQYAPEWSKSANVTFTFPTSPPYDIRVAFNSGGGAWSYVGTDCKLVAQSSPTMNLGWIGADVIFHEFGHTLGLFHEHQNPTGGICWNEPNVISDLQGPPNNWSIPMIRFNVLDKLNANDVLTSAWDKTSIMHYPIPARWTCNNVAIPGGVTISQPDRDFIRLRYPGNNPPTNDVTLTSTQIDNIVALLNARQTEADTMAARLRRSNAQIKTSLKR